MFLQQLIILGLLSGAILSLVGVGFTFVLGVGKIPNFAHGAFVAVGMYLGYWWEDAFGLNPYVMFVPAVLIFAAVGWVVAELFEARGRKFGAIGELLVGLALLLVINGSLAVVFGEEPKLMTGVDFGYVSTSGLRLPVTQIIAAAFTLLLAIAMYAFVRRSRWGRALSAVAENPGAAALYGIRVPIAQRVAVTLSIVLAGVAGLMISPFTVLTPAAGTAYLISAFAVVILGGIGNTIGAVAAGLGIGLVNSLAAGYLSSVWSTLAPLIVILAFMLVRPRSLDV